MGQAGGWGQRFGVVLVGLWALVGVGLVAGFGLGAATAASDDAAAFVSAINSSRASLAGVPALTPAADLDDVAARHAAEMVERGAIFHNPSLGQQVTGWEVVGENVGVGPDVATLHQAFLDSPGHRANLLDSRFTEVGIGVVTSGDRLWVVEVFRKPATTVAAAPAPAPAPSAPAQVAAPASAPKVVAPKVVAPKPVATPVPAPAAEAVASTAAPAPAPAVHEPTADELADQAATRWVSPIQPTEHMVLTGRTVAHVTDDLGRTASLALALWVLVLLLLAGQVRRVQPASERRSGLALQTA